jgi:hypothetical protein
MHVASWGGGECDCGCNSDTTGVVMIHVKFDVESLAAIRLCQVTYVKRYTPTRLHISGGAPHYLRYMNQSSVWAATSECKQKQREGKIVANDLLQISRCAIIVTARVPTVAKQICICAVWIKPPYKCFRPIASRRKATWCWVCGPKNLALLSLDARSYWQYWAAWGLSILLLI